MDLVLVSRSTCIVQTMGLHLLSCHVLCAAHLAALAMSVLGVILQGVALALQLPAWVLSTADIKNMFMFEWLCASGAICAATSVDLCVETELQGVRLVAVVNR